MSSFFLGIDTSNYTTSIAICDENGNIVFDKRRLLTVKQGMRGLRQSDALFLHIKNLPELFEEIDFDFKKICAVGASVSPRRVEGSYMPVFLGGYETARIFAKTHDVPLYEFSHQEGHIRAGIFSCGGMDDDEFYAVHISGGTTEILSVMRDGIRFETEIVGKTLDISAGQLIDRIGVYMGLSFPCGRELEKNCNPDCKLPALPVCVKGCDIHLSGTETKAQRIADDGAALGDMAYLLFGAVADSLCKALLNVYRTHGEKKILFVGGVASNKIIKEKITDKFGQKALFCLPNYSTDNATGIAHMTGDYYGKQRNTYCNGISS